MDSIRLVWTSFRAEYKKTPLKLKVPVSQHRSLTFVQAC